MNDERQSWRKVFEMVGPETLRLRLGRNEYSGEYSREAEKWLLEKDAEAATVERERFQTIRRWAIIGGVAAVIAAVAAVIGALPIVKVWIG